MNNLQNKWWLVATAALTVASFFGVRAVMAQETTTPEATAPATQETPAAQDAPGASETPATGPELRPDDESERHTDGCGKFVDHEALAAFLGVTPDELRTELQADGATLATVAEAHGQTREALIAFVTGEARAALAEKVAAGSLTQAEADERLADFSDRVDELVDASGGFGRGRHHWSGFGQTEPQS